MYRLTEAKEGKFLVITIELIIQKQIYTICQDEENDSCHIELQHVCLHL